LQVNVTADPDDLAAVAEPPASADLDAVFVARRDCSAYGRRIDRA